MCGASGTGSHISIRFTHAQNAQMEIAKVLQSLILKIKKSSGVCYCYIL